MKIEIDESGTLVLKEVFSGVALETAEGNRIGVCMRDDTMEINVLPKGATESSWHRVNMQTGEINSPDSTPQRDEGSPRHCLGDTEKFDPETMCYACLGRDGYHLEGCLAEQLQTEQGKRLDALEEREDRLHEQGDRRSFEIDRHDERMKVIETHVADLHTLRRNDMDSADIVMGQLRRELEEVTERVKALEPKLEAEKRATGSRVQPCPGPDCGVHGIYRSDEELLCVGCGRERTFSNGPPES